MGAFLWPRLPTACPVPGQFTTSGSGSAQPRLAWPPQPDLVRSAQPDLLRSAQPRRVRVSSATSDPGQPAAAPGRVLPRPELMNMIPTIVFTHRTDLRGPDETSHGQAAVHDRAGRPAGAALPAGTVQARMPGRPAGTSRAVAGL